MNVSNEKKNAETVKKLKAPIKQEQAALEKHINEYSEKYKDFLYDVLFKCKLTGGVIRKSDGVRGELRVLSRYEKYAFYEPYVITFVPYEEHMPREELYNVLSVVERFEKIRRK